MELTNMLGKFSPVSFFQAPSRVVVRRRILHYLNYLLEPREKVIQNIFRVKGEEREREREREKEREKE